MNNEENKPSKDMMDMIKEHTDKTCDMVIDKCIEIVNDAYLGFDGDVMLKGKYTNEVFMSIIQRLNNLKNKQQ